MTDGVQGIKEEIIAAVKPRLRGWLHVGAFPMAFISGTILVILAPAGAPRWAAVIFAGTSVLLFGISAIYHRGNWSPRPLSILQRLDHANIYLVIAGSYTPFAALALSRTPSRVILVVVWSGALAGVLFRIMWTNAPRWLYTSLYILVGWAAVFVIPQLVDSAGLAATILVGVGGLLYTIGGAVYATKWPNPAPRWFGFHEVFHALTVAAWIIHYIAVSMVVYRSA